MSSQTTDTVLLVRPSAFGYDPETADTNAFQAAPDEPAHSLAALAVSEFDRAVETLLAEGLAVHVAADPDDPPCPDAVFPNNWFSTHGADGVVLYPMLTSSRRSERDGPAREALRAFFGNRVHDFTGHESEGRALEGTGSLVLDRVGRVAYASLSRRTDEALVHGWCERFGYRPHVFRAADPAGVPFYHTNVVLSVGTSFAVVGEEAVDPGDRDALRRSLEASGREVVPVTGAQLARFAANGLELASPTGPVFVLSRTALESLGLDQVAALSRHARLVPVEIPTIERVGGGSARCMIAEIFPAEKR